MSRRLFPSQTRPILPVHTAYLGLGSNRGDRRAHLQAAVEGLATTDGIRVTAVSPLYETEAHTLDPEEDQRAFVNAVVEGTVTCPPEALLRRAHQVEAQEGRQRQGSPRWAPRPLDVDLLTVGTITRATDVLTLPHPRLAERQFVLQPWNDLAPDHRVPAPFEATVQQLLEQCADAASVRQMEKSLSFPPSSGPGR